MSYTDLTAVDEHADFSLDEPVTRQTSSKKPASTAGKRPSTPNIPEDEWSLLAQQMCMEALGTAIGEDTRMLTHRASLTALGNAILSIALSLHSADTLDEKDSAVDLLIATTVAYKKALTCLRSADM